MVDKQRDFLEEGMDLVMNGIPTPDTVIFNSEEDYIDYLKSAGYNDQEITKKLKEIVKE